MTEGGTKQDNKATTKSSTSTNNGDSNSNSKELLEKILVTDLSPKTKTNYESCARALVAKAEQSLQYIIEHPNVYIPLLRKWYDKDTTYKVNLSFILGLFKYNKHLQVDHAAAYEKWAKAFKDADNVVNSRYETNEPTDRQIDGYVPYANIIKARDELPEGSIKRLLLGMYTYLRPMRCEYARVAIYKTRVPASPKAEANAEPKIEPNYILLNKGRLIINHFKTRKHHDGYDITLPKPLLDDLISSLESEPREWLFTNAKGEPYSPSLFSSWTMRVFKSIFKKPLTVALIRHSYINTLDFNALSVAEKKEIALSMGHTVGTQDRYRLIFDD